MIFRILFTFIVFLLVCVPAIIVSVPVVAMLLLTGWDGRSSIFGNVKHGRATDHYLYPTRHEYWREFNWLVLRNPVNNLQAVTLAARQRIYTLAGDAGIGDKRIGGFYKIYMLGGAWEYYWIKPYGKRCIRVRIGWKIQGNAEAALAPFVFVINPWKSYAGI